MFRILFPAEPRDFRSRRTLLTLLRALHILTSGTLLGGHIFALPVETLGFWLTATIATGLAIIILNVHATMAFFFEMRGITIVIKIGLLFLVPVFDSASIPILVLILFIGVFSSHLPGRYRHKVFFLDKNISPDRRNG